eukprot:4997647-Prymnesium_polylepis.1
MLSGPLQSPSHKNPCPGDVARSTGGRDLSRSCPFVLVLARWVPSMAPAPKENCGGSGNNSPRDK